MGHVLPTIGTKYMEGPIWITGGGGLIGSYIARSCPLGGHCVALTRNALDLLDCGAVENAFKRGRPLAVIHCAALSKSPACEANPTLAKRINVDVTALLAQLAANIPFVFFSTDLVFDGRAGNYDESARVNPLSVYAETKAIAEQQVLQNPRHTVIRTSLNGGTSPTGDRGFNEEIRRAWREGRTLRFFVDEFRSPIAASVTARAVWELMEGNQPGLFHLAGSERLSRWEIGQLLAQRNPENTPRLEPSSIKDYAGPPRPPDTSLNCAKIQQLLSFPLPAFRSWLASNLEEAF